jgi:hypothetical protein
MNDSKLSDEFLLASCSQFKRGVRGGQNLSTRCDARHKSKKINAEIWQSYLDAGSRFAVADLEGLDKVL